MRQLMVLFKEKPQLTY